MGKIRLIGTIEAKVDMKGRVFLPAVFRRLLGAGGDYHLILRKDVFEDCLVLYTEDEWYKRLDELHARLNRWNRKHQDIFRRFVADAEWITLDAGGRFLIPKRYLRMAAIEQEVVFVGMDDTIEIWAKGKLLSEDSESIGNELEDIMSQSAGSDE